jgi:hypothetical protein
MNGRPLTDVRISQALRAHLPQSAPSGLRERILDAAETTTQQRPLPSFLGALGEADPVARRRSLLIAAALLVALALASAAAVGALRLLEPDPLEDLSLEPPADLQAFVLSSHDRMPELPPVAMTWHRDGSTTGRIYVDRSGAVRFERYASADATEPTTYMILSGRSIGSLETVGSEKVWVVSEAISDDPRVFIRTEIADGQIRFGGLGCELERSPDEAGNGTAATGWTYVGVEYVAGRAAHHVTCGGGDLWLDIETRLILGARALLLDDAGQPIAGEFRTIEVTEIAFGEQPAALFDLEPPEGIVGVAPEGLEAYRCSRDPICSALPPSARPTQGDTGTPWNDSFPGNGPTANP